jgi:membrane protease YdiL (CAAX protease family)
MSTEQHSIGKSLAMHLLPGVLIVSLFVATAPILMRAGFPPLFAMSTIGMTIGLGFQIWHLYNEGRKRNGKWSLEGIVGYREPMPIAHYFAYVPLFVILAFILNTLTQPLGSALLKLCPWIPAWFEMRNVQELVQYSRSHLMITFVPYLLMNGIAAPIIEELYFRGYLMSRLSRFGKWTPIVETGLFTLYHFWQPYYWVTQFLSMLPVIYAVWWKKNVKIGIWVHFMLNFVGGLLTMALVLGQVK